MGCVAGYWVEGVSQPATGRGSQCPPRGKAPLSCWRQDWARRLGWRDSLSSTLALGLVSSNEILYIIFPSFNPFPFHRTPPCAQPSWPLSPSPRSRLPFLLPCGSFCFSRWHLAGHSYHPPPRSPQIPSLSKVPFPLPHPHPRPSSDSAGDWRMHSFSPSVACPPSLLWDPRP